MTPADTLRAAAIRLRERAEGLRAGIWPVYMDPLTRERLADEAEQTADLLDEIADGVEAHEENGTALTLDGPAEEVIHGYTSALRLAELIAGGAA